MANVLPKNVKELETMLPSIVERVNKGESFCVVFNRQTHNGFKPYVIFNVLRFNPYSSSYYHVKMENNLLPESWRKLIAKALSA